MALFLQNSGEEKEEKNVETALILKSLILNSVSIPREQDKNPTNLLSHAISIFEVSVIAYPVSIMSSYDFVFNLLELFKCISTLQDSYLAHPHYL